MNPCSSRYPVNMEVYHSACLFEHVAKMVRIQQSGSSCLEPQLYTTTAHVRINSDIDELRHQAGLPSMAVIDVKSKEMPATLKNQLLREISNSTATNDVTESRPSNTVSADEIESRRSESDSPQSATAHLLIDVACINTSDHEDDSLLLDRDATTHHKRSDSRRSSDRKHKHRDDRKPTHDYVVTKQTQVSSHAAAPNKETDEEKEKRRQERRDRHRADDNYRKQRTGSKERHRHHVTSEHESSNERRSRDNKSRNKRIDKKSADKSDASDSDVTLTNENGDDNNYSNSKQEVTTDDAKSKSSSKRTKSSSKSHHDEREKSSKSRHSNQRSRSEKVRSESVTIASEDENNNKGISRQDTDSHRQRSSSERKHSERKHKSESRKVKTTTSSREKENKEKKNTSYPANERDRRRKSTSEDKRKRSKERRWRPIRRGSSTSTLVDVKSGRNMRALPRTSSPRSTASRGQRKQELMQYLEDQKLQVSKSEEFRQVAQMLINDVYLRKDKSLQKLISDVYPTHTTTATTRASLRSKRRKSRDAPRSHVTDDMSLPLYSHDESDHSVYTEPIRGSRKYRAADPTKRPSSALHVLYKEGSLKGYSPRSSVHSYTPTSQSIVGNQRSRHPTPSWVVADAITSSYEKEQLLNAVKQELRFIRQV